MSLCGEGEMNLHNSLLIIDEIQNLISETGSYYTELKKIIKKSDNTLRIVLLSATPMFDKPSEIALTINLLKPVQKLPTGVNFEKTFIKKTKKGDEYAFTAKNLDKFEKLIKGYISYYRGAPPYTFPSMTVKYVRCEMGNFQYSAYKSVLNNEGGYPAKVKKRLVNVDNLPNNFFIGTRYVSNVVFPNKLVDDKGFKSFEGNAILKNLKKYSTKFSKIMKKLKSRGKHFLYSAFKEYAGIKSMARVLDTFGYKNYVIHGPGKKRYAIWSGDEDTSVKDEIRNVFNNINNLNGEKIKIILGSPSIKEGVSLKAVRYVHIVETYWNQSRIDQIIGRASRFCSHQDLPEEMRNVKVYIYIATHISKNEDKPEERTIDQYIKTLSDNKNKIVKLFEKCLKESAVDCYLNKNLNVYKGEEDIKCTK